jgi:hypothetical protein
MSGRQAKGFKASMIIDREDAYGVMRAAAARRAYRVPMMTNGITAVPKLTVDKDTIVGRRDPTEPSKGDIEASGTIKVPLDAHNFGLHLANIFGDPVSTAEVAALHPNAAAAVNLGNGRVGIPCTAHGLSWGAPIVIAGTTHYDGAYILTTDSTADRIVIAATYTAETFLGTETINLGRKVVISGAARDAGSGKVGLPAAAHGLPVGSRIVVSGSAHYAATYTVLRGTTANELLVTATYEAETLTASAVCHYWDKTFKIQDEMPSWGCEKGFPGIPMYLWFRGGKVKKLSLSLSDSGVLSASFDMLGANEDKIQDDSGDPAPYDASPVELPVAKYEKAHLSIIEGGAVSSNRITTYTLDVDFGLEGKPTINAPGKTGELGDITEGIMEISGKLEALFKDASFLDKALGFQTSSLEALLSREGYQLSFKVEELKYEQSTPSIDGPAGVLESHNYQGFYASGASDSAIVVRVRNEMYSLTE